MSAAKRTTGKAEDTKVEGAKAESSAPKNEAPKAQAPKAPSTESESPVADDAAAKTQRKAEDKGEAKPKADDKKVPDVKRRGLSAAYDPVVVEADEEASRAAKISQQKVKGSASRQVRQFDTSQSGRSVLDAVHTPGKGKDKK